MNAQTSLMVKLVALVAAAVFFLIGAFDDGNWGQWVALGFLAVTVWKMIDAINESGVFDRRA